MSEKVKNATCKTCKGENGLEGEDHSDTPTAWYPCPECNHPKVPRRCPECRGTGRLPFCRWDDNQHDFLESDGGCYEQTCSYCGGTEVDTP